MKKVFLGLGFATMASAGVVSISAFRHQPTVRPNTFVGGQNVGGLSPEEAAFKLRAWWEGERVKRLMLKSPYLKKSLPGMTPGQLGVTLDDLGTVAKLPMQDFLSDVTNQESERLDVEPEFKPNGMNLQPFEAAVAAALPPPGPATVAYVKGAIVRKPEVAGFRLQKEQLGQAVIAAIGGGAPVQLPIEEAPKKFKDEDLAKIKEVVAEFSTRFPYNRNRQTNIKVAAGKLDGVVLMPGERVSFNGTVGQRTVTAGFREAGVYANGRHDTGIGGGICQVSTTLYNAALFANMKVVERRNHSMPVAYVPVGRDATVNWGTTDLVLENNFGQPIAIDSEYLPGKLTFRILGSKVPGMSVKIQRVGLQSWRPPEKTVTDPALPAGRRRVVEKGSSGHSVNTFRLVYVNGQLQKREPLGRSYYAGGSRIVAVGSRKAVPKAPASPVATNTAPAGMPGPSPVETGE